MEGMDGIEATKRICQEIEDAKIIVLTSFIDDDKVYPVIEAGALSYLLKHPRQEKLLMPSDLQVSANQDLNQKWLERS